MFPDESTKWFLDHIIEAFGVLTLIISSLITYVWNTTNRAHERALKDHKEASEKALNEHKAMNSQMHADTKEELTLHRQYFGKIFDKMEENRTQIFVAIANLNDKSEARHERIMDKLDGKKDK